jgi:CheY-like chemotaxis protein
MAHDVDTTAVFHPLRILVIEDNPDGRETLRVLLALLGHQVKVAGDGLEGVSLALSWRPEVALVDIGLPRLDGFEVARRLRAALGPRIFLIAQTGYGRPEDRRQGLAAGFDVHLVKPLQLEDLCHWLTVAAGKVATTPDNGRPCWTPPCPDVHQSRARTAPF